MTGMASDESVEGYTEGTFSTAVSSMSADDRAAQLMTEANQSLVRRPAYWYAAVIKLNAQLGLGDQAAARRTLDDLLMVKRDFSPNFVEWTPLSAW